MDAGSVHTIRKTNAGALTKHDVIQGQEVDGIKK